jgi:hypothetical protein
MLFSLISHLFYSQEQEVENMKPKIALESALRHKQDEIRYTNLATVQNV